MVTVTYKKEKEKAPQCVYELSYDVWYRLTLETGVTGVGVRKAHAFDTGCLFLITDKGDVHTYTSNNLKLCGVTERVDLDIAVTTEMSSGRPS